MHNLNININAQGKYCVSYTSDGNVHSIQLNRSVCGKIRIYSQQGTADPVMLAEYPQHTISNFYGKFYCAAGYTVIIESDVDIFAAWEDVVAVPGSATEPLPANVQNVVTNIQALIDNIKGTAGSASAATPAIDSNSEMASFLEGYTNEDKLKDIIPQTITEEQLATLRSMIQ